MKIGVFDSGINVMHIERDFKLFEAAKRASGAQMSEGFVPRVAAPFLPFHFVAASTNRFVSGEFRGVGLSAASAQKRFFRVRFQPVFLEPAPHIDLRTADFERDLRRTHSPLDQGLKLRFAGRNDQFAHNSILNQFHIRRALMLGDAPDLKGFDVVRLQM